MLSSTRRVYLLAALTIGLLSVCLASPQPPPGPSSLSGSPPPPGGALGTNSSSPDKNTSKPDVSKTPDTKSDLLSPKPLEASKDGLSGSLKSPGPGCTCPPNDNTPPVTPKIDAKPPSENKPPEEPTATKSDSAGNNLLGYLRTEGKLGFIAMHSIAAILTLAF